MAYAISMVSCISPDQEILEDDEQPWKVGDCILGNFFFVPYSLLFAFFGGGLGKLQNRYLYLKFDTKQTYELFSNDRSKITKS